LANTLGNCRDLCVIDAARSVQSIGC
jgi:hypothetical protein